MRFPVEWLKKYTTKFPKDLKILTDKLSMTGFMLDKPVADVAGYKVIDLEFRRNRPDVEGMVGMAREVVAAFGGEVKMPKLTKIKDAGDLRACEIKVEAKDLVDRFYALHLKVEPKPTPEWMTKRLQAYGEEPSGNVIIDITNYVTFELGQPMHAFDLDMLGQTLTLREAEKGEKISVIGGKEVELDEKDLLIAGSNGPLAIAGVIGGEAALITENTKEIILESGVYDRVSVRLTSRRLGLMTEAADRLQKDRDPNVIDLALRRAVHLLQKYAGAELVAGDDYYPNPIEPWMVEFDPKEVKRYGGVEIPEFDMVQILKRLGFKVEKGREAGGIWEVEVPTFRTDVHLDVDLVEEILRIWGYESIPTINMETPIPDPIHIPEYELEDEIRDLLVAMGIDEFITVPSATLEKLEASYENAKHKELKNAVKIETPATADYTYMRTNMFATLLDSVKTKIDAGNDRIAAFEVGRIYFEDKSVKDDVPYREDRRVAGVVTDKDKNYTLLDAKGIVETVLTELGIEFEWKDGTVLEAVADKKSVAWIGELESKFYTFELDIDELVKCERKFKNMGRWSEYPKVLRDISVIVDKDVKSGEIEEISKKVGGKILYDIVPTDVYTGDKVPAKKKNIVYSLTYWSKEKTLTAKEVDKVHKKIGETLMKKLNAEISGW